MNHQATDSNRTTVSTIMDGLDNSGFRGGSSDERSNFVESRERSISPYVRDERSTFSPPAFVERRTNDPIFTLSASRENNSFQTGSDETIRRKALRASVDDNRVALALGLTLLGCNLSWVWFLMDPRPLSWITFSALGIINSSVNFFLCLLCSQRIAAGFRSFCSALAARVSGKLST